MSIFRVEKNKNFTVMSNYHLRDNNLSYKARGILSTILSLPDDWDYTLVGLAKISKDGIASLRAGIIELEEAGYIKRTQGRDSSGKYAKSVYNVYEIPPKNAAISKSADIKNEFNKQELMKNEDTPLCDFPSTDNLITEKSLSENSTEINTNIINTKEINTVYNNQSIYQSDTVNKKEIDGLIDSKKQSEKAAKDYEEYKEVIKNNIEYDILYSRAGFGDKELLNDIVEIMTETVAFNNKPIKINGNDVPAEIVKNRFLKISSEEVDYVLDMFSKTTSKIGNIRAYLIAMIYNSKTTQNSYYQSLAQHDLYS